MNLTPSYCTVIVFAPTGTYGAWARLLQPALLPAARIQRWTNPACAMLFVAGPAGWWVWHDTDRYITWPNLTSVCRVQEKGTVIRRLLNSQAQRIDRCQFSLQWTSSYIIMPTSPLVLMRPLH